MFRTHRTCLEHIEYMYRTHRICIEHIEHRKLKKIHFEARNHETIYSN